MLARRLLTLFGGFAVGWFSLGGDAIAQSGSWAEKAPILTARSGLAVGNVNGVFYAIGGWDAGANVVEAYDSAANTWAAKASLPTPRAVLAAGVVDGIVYAVGGNSLAPGTYGDLGTNEAYYPASNTWASKAPMPTTRYQLAVGVINGKLYAVGGLDASGSNFLATVEAYDPTTNMWETRASMPTPRGGLTVAVAGDILYAIGGYLPGSALATVEAYDPVTDTWVAKAPMSTERLFASAVAIGGTIYVAGGANSSGLLGTVEAYDIATGTWTTTPPLLHPRYYAGAAAANGLFYMISGSDFAAALSSVEAFTPSTPPAGPTAADDAFSTSEDTTLTVLSPGVLLNDSDPNGFPLTAVLVSGPSHGGLTLSADGSFTYVPSLNYNGADSFIYRASNGFGTSNLAVVTITLSPVNDPPVASADGPYQGVVGVSVQMDASASFDIEGATLIYTWDFGDGSTLQVTGQPVVQHAYAAAGTFPVTLVVNDGQLDSAHFTTQATIGSTAGDGGGGSAAVNAFLTTGVRS